MVFEKHEASIKNMFMKEKSARVNYIHKLRLKEDTSSNYYESTDDDNKKN
jgi:hypothetical protein